jgi:hypothetical protein
MVGSAFLLSEIFSKVEKYRTIVQSNGRRCMNVPIPLGIKTTALKNVTPMMTARRRRLLRSTQRSTPQAGHNHLDQILALKLSLIQETRFPHCGHERLSNTGFISSPTERYGCAASVSWYVHQPIVRDSGCNPSELRPINYAVGLGAGCQLRRGLQLLDADRARIFEGIVDPHPRHRAGSLPHPTPADQKSLSAPEL